ncbi:MAG: adenosylcobinamide-GDP ribazoletransferase [Lachnospiraceae bacterium]|nr:adenosylcobinamide-GDP ribazoletransferase [Lachnospiraceae bacterium]
MNIFRWLAVSLSIYSRIPMPVFEWTEDDYRHNLLFFPLVGAIIAALIIAVTNIPLTDVIPMLIDTVLVVLIPIVVTGGFHIDGFMDTEDALRSYGDTRKKLEILKDPHIGAFAVIGLVRVILIFTAGVGLVIFFGDFFSRCVLGLIFVFYRALSGELSIKLKKAKNDGMLVGETQNTPKSVVIALDSFLLGSGYLMLTFAPVRAFAVLCFTVIYALYYRHLSYKNFGGVTGDTAGFFVTEGEALSALVLGVMCYLLR